MCVRESPVFGSGSLLPAQAPDDMTFTFGPPFELANQTKGTLPPKHRWKSLQSPSQELAAARARLARSVPALRWRAARPSIFWDLPLSECV